MALIRPTIDRPRELDLLVSALRSTDGVHGVVIVGESGVGKTTLARQAAQSLGRSVRWIACTESSCTIPLGAFAHLVGASTPRDPLTFMAAARSTLLADGQVVIGVDDAHLLDDLSATLLHQLAIDGDATIVATVRSGEPVPDAVTSLWKDGHLTRIELPPFTKEQSLKFLDTALGGPIEGFSADLMWDESGGNALYLHHLVEGAVASGTLQQVRGVWQLRGHTSVTVELSELLGRRIEQLPDDVRHVLDLLAFYEPIDVDVLASLAGEGAVDDAETRSMIRVFDSGTQLLAQFTHPLVGEVLRRTLGTLPSRRLRGKLVDALGNRPADAAADRIRLAQLVLGSDRRVDASLLEAAAQDAVSLANITLGEQLSRAALAHGAGIGSAVLLARSMLWSGRARDSEDLLAGYDPADFDELQLVQWGASSIATSWWTGHTDRVDGLFALLRERITFPALTLVVDAISAVAHAFENRLDDAIDGATAVLAESDAPPPAVQWSSLAATLSYAVSGRANSTRAVIAALNSTGVRTDGLLRFTVGYGEVLALTLTGELDEASARADEFVAMSNTGDHMSWAMSNVVVAQVLLARGNAGDARSRLDQSLAAFTSQSSAAWMCAVRILAAQAYSLLGSTDAAARLLAESDRLDGRFSAVFAPQLELTRAWHAAAEGRVAAAIRHARAAAESACSSGQFGVEAAALHSAARFGDRSVAGRLGELVSVVDGRWIKPQRQHAEAVADGNGAALDAVSAEFEALGFLLSAADASAQASTAHHRNGDRRAVAESSATANRLAAVCGGITTPALSTAAQPLSLTTREREIANMVGAGLSNRQIADRLFVSVRTVEGHLYRACSKLDVSDREALAKFVVAGTP